MNCRVCQSKLPPPFLDLGDQPLPNKLTTEPEAKVETFPLALAHCPMCATTQLTVDVPPEKMFSTYLYKPGLSATFVQHFRSMASTLAARFGKPGDLVVDVGSNDGTLLRYLAARGMRVLGIEPASNIAQEANELGTPTRNEFLTTGCARDVLAAVGQANIVTATNVFAHTPDIHEMTASVKRLLAPDGVFVLEVVDVLAMLQHGTFDLIYHEHYFTWSLSSLQWLFASHAMQVFDCEDVSTHGGSIRVYVQGEGGKYTVAKDVIKERLARESREISPEVLARFANGAQSVRAAISDLFMKYGTVIGYGAPAKATVLITYCGVNAERMPYIIDDNHLKQGKYIPGTAIEVVASTDGRVQQREWPAVVVWPWNVADDILPRLGRLTHDAIVPMPRPRVYRV